MKKRVAIVCVVGVLSTILVLVLSGLRTWGPNQRRPKPRMPTITTLPAFPIIPRSGAGLSQQQRNEAIQTLVKHKVSTYPATSSRSYRVGKFTSTGIFGGFPPTGDQIARIAPHYNDILLGAARRELIPHFKQYNPELTFFIYVDSGLNPGFVQSDAGGVDAENLAWVLEHHPDWMLKDKNGQFIRSGKSRFGNRGEYWPDPGHPGWQNYFAEKVTKLIRETGGQWNGVLLDQFIGTADGYARYAGANQQVLYPTDKAFQAAQLRFLVAVAARIRLPIIVNMEGASIIRRPAFVGEVARAAGGVENEIFPEQMPSEDLRPYLETVENLPPHVRVRINSKPAGLAGNIDRTLFAYYSYLLVADRKREVYWTCKEGASDVPHYWYREFDLDLGNSQGNIRFGESIWSREFENAVVLVNPGKETGAYSFEASVRYHDVKGTLVLSPVVLKSRTAMLLIKNLSILPK